MGIIRPLPWPAAICVVGAACSSGAPVAESVPLSVEVPIGAPGVQDGRAEFADVFCATLEHLAADGWGPCGDYVDHPATGSGDFSAPPLPTGFRVLVVSGVLAGCIENRVQAFSRARLHLEERHGLSIEYLALPGLGGVEHNSGRIARYLREHGPTDPRPYILIGFSKGASDLMDALAYEPDIRAHAAALVTVAGSVGGSWAADSGDDAVAGVLGKLGGLGCGTGDALGLGSLTRGQRRAFLADHPEPYVPTYAVVAVSSREETSSVLRPAWDWVAQYSLQQDGMMAVPDALPPGSTLLAVARGDHWAVALPFDSGDDSTLATLVNRNRFPRPALLEAVLRYVGRDLARADGAGPEVPYASTDE